MRHILHVNGQIVNTVEFPASEYSIRTPGCETVPAPAMRDEVWQDVVSNPTLYRYKNGEIILNGKGNMNVAEST